jgi:hypothetical protein
LIKPSISETAFLRQHSIEIEQIFDARGLPGAEWKRQAKELGFLFVYGNPCTNGGHRIKSRAGHCIECNTARIAYMKRETASADLYIAVASRGALFKIGVTNDRFSREVSLRKQRYGGACDWKIIASRRIDNSQFVEREILDDLWERKTTGTHFKDGRDVVAGEMMSGPLAEIWRVFQKHTKATPIKDRWKDAALFEKYMN